MDTLNSLWTFVEIATYAFVIFLFFHDPIRRWNFFGYRPTAVMGLFDPILGKVLLSRINGAWSFNQGGMYENNIYLTVETILKRELGMPETRYKLSYTRPLGTVRITEKNLVNRARISTVSLFATARGKGYLACFLRANLDGVESDIRPGSGVQEVRLVDYAEARQRIQEHTVGEHRVEKQRLLLAMLDEIETYAGGLKDWESKNLAPVQEAGA